MSELALILSAFLMGMFGSVHCAAMCGGLSIYLHSQPGKTDSKSLLIRSTMLGAGRLTSYAIAGLVAAGFGATLFNLIGQPVARTTMTLAVGLFLILVGLQITGWWSGLAFGGQAGQRVWRWLQPLSRRVLPVNTPMRAFAAGALWGWLPCGLVYSVLLLVTGGGNMLAGSLAMVAFGIGTMPMVSVIGVAGQRISVSRIQPLRQSAGIVLMALGAVTVLAISGPMTMQH